MTQNYCAHLIFCPEFLQVDLSWNVLRFFWDFKMTATVLTDCLIWQETDKPAHDVTHIILFYSAYKFSHTILFKDAIPSATATMQAFSFACEASNIEVQIGDRLLHLNLLHAEVSYIIDTACRWTFFFPILPVLATFWSAKTPIFFHYPIPSFCWTLPSNLCSPMLGLDYSAKTRY